MPNVQMLDAHLTFCAQLNMSCTTSFLHRWFILLQVPVYCQSYCLVWMLISPSTTLYHLSAGQSHIKHLCKKQRF